MTEKEKVFMTNWATERLKPNKMLPFFFIGLRNASLFMALIMLSLLSGWYKRVPLLSSGLMITFFIAIGITMVIMAFFYAQYQVDKNEQHYLELCQKQKSNNHLKNN